MIKVQILTDDRVRKAGLLAEHGLSLWIEKDGKSILFDTGQSEVFCRNAKVMGIDIRKADYIIISHGHYDHCGGLKYYINEGRTEGIAEAKMPQIYAHRDVFLKKFVAVNNGEPLKEIGIPFEISAIDQIRDNIIYNEKPSRLEESIIISGEIPYSNDFEKLSGIFYVEKKGRIISDTMADEQMLIIEDGGEMAVFLGCSHPGIVNSVEYAQKLVPGKRIKLLIAGMHLDSAGSEQLEKTVSRLLDMEIKTVVPLHCTGFNAMCRMRNVLGKRYQLLCTGDELAV